MFRVCRSEKGIGKTVIPSNNHWGRYNKQEDIIRLLYLWSWKFVPTTGEMVQQHWLLFLGAPFFPALTCCLGTCNSSSRESCALFWSLWGPSKHINTHTHKVTNFFPCIALFYVYFSIFLRQDLILFPGFLCPINNLL